LIESKQHTINKKHIRDNVYNLFDKDLVEPILQYLTRMNNLDTDSAAHILNFSIKEPSDLILKLSADLIKKADVDLLINFNFSVSKWSLFAQVFEKGY
jgi:hypothetical protein